MSIAISTIHTDEAEYPLSARSIGRSPRTSIATMPSSTTCDPGIGWSMSPPMVAKNTPTRRQSSAVTPSGRGKRWAMTT